MADQKESDYPWTKVAARTLREGHNDFEMITTINTNYKFPRWLNEHQKDHLLLAAAAIACNGIINWDHSQSGQFRKFRTRINPHLFEDEMEGIPENNLHVAVKVGDGQYINLPTQAIASNRGQTVHNVFHTLERLDPSPSEFMEHFSNAITTKPVDELLTEASRMRQPLLRRVLPPEIQQRVEKLEQAPVVIRLADPDEFDGYRDNLFQKPNGTGDQPIEIIVSRGDPPRIAMKSSHAVQDANPDAIPLTEAIARMMGGIIDVYPRQMKEKLRAGNLHEGTVVGELLDLNLPLDSPRTRLLNMLKGKRHPEVMVKGIINAEAMLETTRVLKRRLKNNHIDTEEHPEAKTTVFHLLLASYLLEYPENIAVFPVDVTATLGVNERVLPGDIYDCAGLSEAMKTKDREKIIEALQQFSIALNHSINLTREGNSLSTQVIRGAASLPPWIYYILDHIGEAVFPDEERYLKGDAQVSSLGVGTSLTEFWTVPASEGHDVALGISGNLMTARVSTPAVKELIGQGDRQLAREEGERVLQNIIGRLNDLTGIINLYES